MTIESHMSERAEESLTRSRAFTHSKYSVDRADAEAYLWRLDSIASSLLAIAKRM